MHLRWLSPLALAAHRKHANGGLLKSPRPLTDINATHGAKFEHRLRTTGPCAKRRTHGRDDHDGESDRQVRDDPPFKTPIVEHTIAAPPLPVAAVAPPATGRRARLRRRVYEIMEIGHGEDRLSKLLDTFLVILIIANIAVFCAETVQQLEDKWGWEFHVFEMFCLVVFTIEYLARLWIAVEVPFLSRLPPWKARLRFAGRAPQIIDLLAILPFYLGHMFGVDLRILRIFRLLRFLKLSRYSPAMHTLIRVLSNERRALMGAGLLLIAAVLFASTGIYFLEHQAQPDKFGSVPESAWWAIATLTTVGYGDVTPHTVGGRIFGGFVMVTGLCVLALPVAIISTGFAQDVNRHDFVVTWSLITRIPLLAELDAEQVALVMPMLHAQYLPPNVEVINKGSPGAAMYFVASGRVRMHTATGDRNFGTGEFFGMVAMLANDLNNAAFITASKCRLLKLYREDFHRFEAASPAIAAHIRKVAEQRRVAAAAANAAPAADASPHQNDQG